jgi:hypothetical protein
MVGRSVILLRIKMEISGELRWLLLLQLQQSSIALCEIVLVRRNYDTRMWMGSWLPKMAQPNSKSTSESMTPRQHIILERKAHFE